MLDRRISSSFVSSSALAVTLWFTVLAPTVQAQDSQPSWPSIHDVKLNLQALADFGTRRYRLSQWKSGKWTQLGTMTLSVEKKPQAWEFGQDIAVNYRGDDLRLSVRLQSPLDRPLRPTSGKVESRGGDEWESYEFTVSGETLTTDAGRTLPFPLSAVGQSCLYSAFGALPRTPDFRASVSGSMQFEDLQLKSRWPVLQYDGTEKRVFGAGSLVTHRYSLAKQSGDPELKAWVMESGVLLRFEVAGDMQLELEGVETLPEVETDSLDQILYGERSNASFRELQSRLASAKPDEREAIRFGTALGRVLNAVDGVANDFYHFGLQPETRRLPIPILELRIPRCPDDQLRSVTYAAIRTSLDRLASELQTAEAILADAEPGDWKLPVDLARLRIRYGNSGTEQTLPFEVLGEIRQDSGTTVQFDAADALWLQGYCNLLLATTNLVRAHDFERLFEHCGHLLFENPKTPFPFLNQGARDRGFQFDSFIDLVALVHLMDFPRTAEAKTLVPDAVERLIRVVDLSESTWSAIRAETDNDAEWLPNGEQDSVFGPKISDEQIDAWLAAARDVRRILRGDLLLPFWRSGTADGVNLRRALLESSRFDLVLWMQGTAVAPYLEEGDIASEEVWRRLDRVFGRRLLPFALWIN